MSCLPWVWSIGSQAVSPLVHKVDTHLKHLGYTIRLLSLLFYLKLDVSCDVYNLLQLKGYQTCRSKFWTLKIFSINQPTSTYQVEVSWCRQHLMLHELVGPLLYQFSITTSLAKQKHVLLRSLFFSITEQTFEAAFEITLRLYIT